MTGLKKILLIDNNPKNLSEILSCYNYQITTVSNKQEIIDVLNTERAFNLILLEINLNPSDNWKILKYIRKHKYYKNIPIIILTVINDDKKMVYGLNLGADDYITKPFSIPNLTARIEAVLRRSKNTYKPQKHNNVTKDTTCHLQTLTEREKDVLLLVTQGENNKAIAKKLVLSEITVKSHLYKIFKKLNAENRIQAVITAKKMNIL